MTLNNSSSRSHAPGSPNTSTMSPGPSETEATSTPHGGSLQRLADAIRRREAAKTYQLPNWPDAVCGVANELLRSALFAATEGRHRKILRGQRVAAHGPYTIEYTGVQLTQAHLDVFEGVMHIARGVDEGTPVPFSAHRLLKLIGRHTGKSEHDWLFLMLQDLTATSLSILKNNTKVFWGSLLPTGAGDLLRGAYVVRVSRELAKLFDRGFTQVQWHQRHALKRKPLACWLQLYYCSHANPYTVTVRFLYEQCGSSTRSLPAFRQKLKIALDEIMTARVITNWKIEADRVTVARIPSASQQRHLQQRRSK